jgi:hypothetical protein
MVFGGVLANWLISRDRDCTNNKYFSMNPLSWLHPREINFSYVSIFLCCTRLFYYITEVAAVLAVSRIDV